MTIYLVLFVLQIGKDTLIFMEVVKHFSSLLKNHQKLIVSIGLEKINILCTLMIMVFR